MCDISSQVADSILVLKDHFSITWHKTGISSGIGTYGCRINFNLVSKTTKSHV